MSNPLAIAPLLPTLTGAPDANAAPATLAQVASLSQEFESLLLLQVMRQMRQTLTSLGGDDEDKAVGGDLGPLTDSIDAEMSRYLSKAGGMGLGKYLSQAISRQTVGATAPAPATSPSTGNLTAPPSSPVSRSGATSTTAPGAPAAIDTSDTTAHDDEDASAAGTATGGVAPSPLAYAGQVTSAYGWRSDPIAHTPHFHSGVDIRAAYGQDVPVAGDGQVVFAGEQSGYGMTVVVQHTGGLQTRYAHLSAMTVRDGDQVTNGQSVGRVGQSGRTTGPHLHFELIQNGRKLDPTPVLQAANEFKQNRVAADYTSGRPHGPEVGTSGLDSHDAWSKP